jgi:hypothetical protein
MHFFIPMHEFVNLLTRHPWSIMTTKKKLEGMEGHVWQRVTCPSSMKQVGI